MRNRVSPWFRRDFDEQYRRIDELALLDVDSTTGLIRVVALGPAEAAFLKFTSTGGFGNLHYDRKLRPLSPLRWAQLFELDCYRQLEFTRLGPDYENYVSTIWLGMPRLSYSAEPRGMFETLVRRDGENDFLRWDTEKEARAEHERIVREEHERLAKVR